MRFVGGDQPVAPDHFPVLNQHQIDRVAGVELIPLESVGAAQIFPAHLFNKYLVTKFMHPAKFYRIMV